MNGLARRVFPFAAIVGQERAKRALLVNAVCPGVGGVLLRGEKGTAKSTAVRGLAALLPEIESVPGCVFGCDPKGALCPDCRVRAASGPLPSAPRRARLVDLPLAATEDRVAGAVDMEAAIREGVRRLDPGLLAQAHRGLLYVDEVNLLPDHIADMVLDACASGLNVVRREGVSAEHPAEFALVGSMNPEEGELRPQLLDRFGLSAEIAAPREPEERLAVLRAREAFDADPDGFLAAHVPAQADLAERIVQARRILKNVRVPRAMLQLIARLAAEANCAGHRGELAMRRAARALAALDGREDVREPDVLEAAELALAHRRRMQAPPPPPPPPEEEHEHDHEHDEPPPQEEEAAPEDDDSGARPEEREAEPQESGEDAGEDAGEERPPPPEEQQGGTPLPDVRQIFAVGAPFRVKPITFRKDRLARKGSGRRTRSRTTMKAGRYVGSLPDAAPTDLALDATLRAAACRGGRRGDGDGPLLDIRREDLRQRRREKKIGNLIVFVVDASGSMGAAQRMSEAKGAVLSLLLDAYQKRDRVAFVAFRGERAEVLLHPTGSVEAAFRHLEELPTGGRTPLADGLAEGFRVIENALRKDPDTFPVLLVISDGRANAAPEGVRPVAAAMLTAGAIAEDGRVRSLVVDVERKGMLSFGLARGLAEALGADHFHIEDLKAETLVQVLKDAALGGQER